MMFPPKDDASHLGMLRLECWGMVRFGTRLVHWGRVPDDASFVGQRAIKHHFGNPRQRHRDNSLQVTASTILQDEGSASLGILPELRSRLIKMFLQAWVRVTPYPTSLITL